MSLPDIARLKSCPAATLRAFGKKLASLGVSLASAHPIVASTQDIPTALQRPARAYHLRRMRKPAGYAMRMFLFGDPVTRDEANATLGDLTAVLLENGLLVSCDDGRVVSPLLLSIIDDLYVLSDDLSRGSDAVMGLAETTSALCAAAFPNHPIERALDLGCGSGTGALLVAKRARHAVGVDINPRAIDLARINAAVNGISNVEFREGDLFAPVAGETFDLILSQPPFIARPEEVSGARFMDGGPRGEELALRLLSQIAEHLGPRGRAVLFVEWPDAGTEPLEHRLRAAIGPRDLDVIVFRMPPVSPDVHATLYAAGIHTELGRPFEAEAMARRTHFERMGIRALLPTIVALEPSEKEHASTWAVHVEAVGKARFSSERIDRAFEARALCSNAERLLEAKLRMPDGTVLAQEQIGPGASEPSTLWARFAPEALILPMQMNVELLALLTLVHEAPNVRAGVERFAEELETPIAEALPRAVDAIEQALLNGFLETATGGPALRSSR